MSDNSPPVPALLARPSKQKPSSINSDDNVNDARIITVPAGMLTPTAASHPTATTATTHVTATATTPPSSTISSTAALDFAVKTPTTSLSSVTITVAAGDGPGNNIPVSNLFHRNPSIRIRRSKDKSKSKSKSKDKDKNKVKAITSLGEPDVPKLSLKRSRSPIKMLKNIKSYLHIHKHKHSTMQGSSNGSGGSFQHLQQGAHNIHNSSFSNNSVNNNNLAPPRSSLDGYSGVGYQYRSASLPSSSILSASTHFTQNNSAADDISLSRMPRDRQTPESLSPEKQVLLLQVVSYFEHAGHRADEDTAAYLLSSYQWDIDQTLQYCQDLVQAVQGTLVPVQQEKTLSGAVNDQMTSCYIDSLLFAMFARLSAFEGLLNVSLDSDTDSDSETSGSGTESADTIPEPRREGDKQETLLHSHLLQTWLRMFVNQLRSGRLVQAHVVKELRQHLYSCGWNCPGPYDPPGSSRQEDASELFMFLTEKLHLPYLPLEQRLLHGAKTSADDDKVITERMLQISIPVPELNSHTSQPITRRLESAMSKLLSSKSSNDNNEDEISSAASSVYEILSLESLLAQHFYDNTLTGIRRLVSSGTGVPLSPEVEVPVSAWQVLKLLPFYSSSNEQGGIIHASQSQYPADVVILPLILKRYSFGHDMRARRIGTPIDIPRRIDFSRFVNRQTFGPSATSSSPPPQDTCADNERDAGSNTDARGNNIVNDNEPKNATGSNSIVLEEPTAPHVSSLSSSSSPPSSPTLRVEPAYCDQIPKSPSVGTTSSGHDIASISINTHLPPVRKYSISLLQAVDSPNTPITPPPQYSPASSSKAYSSFNSTTLGDEKKGWSPRPPPEEPFGGDYMDCRQPKVKYMLELKSVVCHIGSRLDSGHYRSYVADQVGKDSTVASDATGGSGYGSAAHPLSFQEPNWLRHDDLDPSGNRVKLILRDSDENMEMEADWAQNGYILFYELQTIHL
ncbi:hypothetical protein BX616_001303 [Lobosporangium transversale]|uniref:ubiquitinyl hydrolase 1 n=1 Tax=Lobosporangium transversale TaxID=64571 RepID=A0A1Y2GZ85_9FUNG|nr:hypothetical protein BCR41DRAFT_392084 [Lobosporangium transversale]KAF9904440.1 hypothetical protein BX616_001303 [Lobosporangium transversale]ORZ27620.1 hypothetical protein BCR41DRAFT_392084 [Lobosporangium transversale]|eukprot:XP_021885323.1 hypothetical protein BCR41DRAFT_392084 [Lobosporangium transversale]